MYTCAYSSLVPTEPSTAGYTSCASIHLAILKKYEGNKEEVPQPMPALNLYIEWDKPFSMNACYSMRNIQLHMKLPHPYKTLLSFHCRCNYTRASCLHIHLAILCTRAHHGNYYATPVVQYLCCNKRDHITPWGTFKGPRSSHTRGWNDKNCTITERTRKLPLR